MIAEPYVDGGLRGVLYRTIQGDSLPMHIHTEADVHVTFVIAGRISVTGPDYSDVHGPGSLVSFSPRVPHQIEAVEDGTVFLNLLKSPQ